MKTRWQRAIVYLVAGSILFTQSGCMGSFKLTKKLYEWNNNVSGDKFVNNLIFWVLGWILPAYGISLFLDVVIFNLVEFWTGSNPIAMKDGDVKIQIVSKHGKEYKFTASKNQIKVEQLDNHQVVVFNYIPEQKTWYLTKDHQEVIKLFTEDDNQFTVYKGNDQISIEKSPTGWNYLQTVMMNNFAMR